MSTTINRLDGKDLEALKPGRHGDGNNLYLQVNPGGSRSWVFRYELGGRQRPMGLGSLQIKSLKEARGEARRLKQMVLDGIDPMGQRAELKQLAIVKAARAGQDETFGGCALAYIKAQAPGWRSEKTVSNWTGSLNEHVLPLIGDMPVAKITTADVRAVLEPIWQTIPWQAQKIRNRIERVLDYAEALDLREGANPAQWRGKLKMVLAKQVDVEVQSHKALAIADAPALMAMLRHSASMTTLALEWLILSAARTAEVRFAAWAEIDLSAKLWIIPGHRMKKGREHRVPISDAMLDVLARLQAMPMPQRARDSGLMFPGAEGEALGERGLYEFCKRRRLGITVHGFRSTFRDWAARHSSLSGDFAELALAHKVKDLDRAQALEKRRLALEAMTKLSQAASEESFDSDVYEKALSKLTGTATTRAYQRDDLLERRRALMEQWAAFLAGAPESNVVAFPRQVSA